MSPSCPISNRRIDTNIVRLISLLIAITTVLLIFTQYTVFAILLLVDFSFRAARMQLYSPFYLTASYLLKYIDIAPHMADEAPKRFALYLGWGISILITLFLLIGYDSLFSLFLWIILVCSLTEAIFDYCIGCTLYHYLLLFGAIRR